MINNLPAQSSTDHFQNQVMTGLSVMLQKIGRKSGAIFFMHPFSLLAQTWISMNIPAEWQKAIADTNSALAKAAYETIENNTFTPANTELGLAAALPLVCNNRRLGAVLFHGDPLNLEDQQRWQAMLEEFIQGFSAFCLEIDHRETEVAVLRVVASALRTDVEFAETQLHVIRETCRLFRAETAQLILFDPLNPNLIIKKQLNLEHDWFNQGSMLIEQGLVSQAIEANRIIALTGVENHPEFNPRADGVPGIQTESLMIAPLYMHGERFGALVLYNPDQSVLSGYHQELLSTLAAALANAIHNAQRLMQFKINNADLEASRLELLHSRNTLRALFDNLPVSIYIVDRAYKIIAINQSRSDRASEKPHLLVGKKCYEAMLDRNSPCASCMVNDTFETGRINSRIAREWIDDEKYIEWEISTYPIWDERMNVQHTIVMEFDVTEKRMLEADLMQSEKLAAVGQLAAGVAHEINNPLTAIIANAQMLLRDLPENDVDTRDSLTMIETAGVRASQVVGNLLGIARREKFSFSQIDLNESIENALSFTHHEITKRPVSIQRNLQPDMPRLYASKDQLQGVWINLILNALDAIEQNNGVISITSRYTGTEYRVTISDNGKGIAEEKLTRIFEPFFTTKVAGRGTGLGLSVCYRVVKQHGGSIKVESQPNQGTKFLVSLPAATVERPAGLDLD
jgi:two-component system NtrC family sensor kinase